MIMGKMQLEGTEVKLKKPLAIMTLVEDKDGNAEYHAAGVVRQKIVFNTRPVPLMKKALDPGPSLCGSKRARRRAFGMSYCCVTDVLRHG